VYAAKRATGEGKDYSMDHSSLVYLLSPNGKLLEALKDSLSADEVAAKIKQQLHSSGEKQ
jgi:protein SCO1/2